MIVHYSDEQLRMLQEMGLNREEACMDYLEEDDGNEGGPISRLSAHYLHFHVQSSKCSRHFHRKDPPCLVSLPCLYTPSNEFLFVRDVQRCTTYRSLAPWCALYCWEPQPYWAPLASSRDSWVPSLSLGSCTSWPVNEITFPFFPERYYRCLSRVAYNDYFPSLLELSLIVL